MNSRSAIIGLCLGLSLLHSNALLPDTSTHEKSELNAKSKPLIRPAYSADGCKERGHRTYKSGLNCYSFEKYTIESILQHSKFKGCCRPCPEKFGMEGGFLETQARHAVKNSPKSDLWKSDALKHHHSTPLYFFQTSSSASKGSSSTSASTKSGTSSKSSGASTTSGANSKSGSSKSQSSSTSGNSARPEESLGTRSAGVGRKASGDGAASNARGNDRTALQDEKKLSTAEMLMDATFPAPPPGGLSGFSSSGFVTGAQIEEMLPCCNVCSNQFEQPETLDDVSVSFAETYESFRNSRSMDAEEVLGTKNILSQANKKSSGADAKSESGGKVKSSATATKSGGSGSKGGATSITSVYDTQTCCYLCDSLTEKENILLELSAKDLRKRGTSDPAPRTGGKRGGCCPICPSMLVMANGGVAEDESFGGPFSDALRSRIRGVDLTDKEHAALENIAEQSATDMASAARNPSLVSLAKMRARAHLSPNSNAVGPPN